MKTFSETLTRLLKGRGLTAKAVCAATGIPSSTLSEWTSGRTPKLSEDLLKLSKFLGVSLEFLVSGEEPEVELLDGLLKSAQEQFVSIHNGVYRIRVEKFVGPSKSKSNKTKE